MDTQLHGIVNIDKDSNTFSTEYVSRARRMLGVRKVGHMGTLDPMATGVLLLGIGKATRLFDYYLRHSKRYVVEVQFGHETDTLDSTGTVVRSTCNIPDADNVKQKALCQVGTIMQLPPMYSAKNIKGQRAYHLTRKGIAPQLRHSQVVVHSISDIVRLDSLKYRWEIHCSSGTYVRSIVRDVAYSLDSLATMTGLIRTQSGNFGILSSIKIDSLNHSSVIPIDSCLPQIERIDLDTKYKQDLHNGRRIDLALQDKECVIYCDEILYGIGYISDGQLYIKTNLYYERYS